MPYFDKEEYEGSLDEPLTEDQHEAFKKISDNLEAARKLVSDAEAIAKKANLPFNPDLGGVVSQEYFHDSGWSSSSIGC